MTEPPTGAMKVRPATEMAGTTSAALAARLDVRSRAWRVTVEETRETPTSLIAFGQRGGEPLVIKLVKGEGDEWESGEIVATFEGRGVVRVHDYVDGALLLERLVPGRPLSALAVGGSDDEATRIIAGVIGEMSPRSAPARAATVEGWGEGFRRYVESGDAQVSPELVEHGMDVYASLAESQGKRRLLHGDLQHYNVLLDDRHGWVAIDPKGVTGEMEYEAGAMLRNPNEAPELLARPATIERRVWMLADALALDARRVLAWGFAQAVLSAIWGVEDGFVVTPRSPSLLLAEAIRPMLAAGWR